jgi:gliding motility-associated-like protein
MIVRLATKAFCLLLATLLVCNVYAQVPAAQFSATPTTGCSPLSVHFTDQSTNNPSGWTWDLGNGTTSHAQNPSGTYFTPGTYTVTLTAANSSGSNTIIKTAYITVSANPVAAFTSNTQAGCIPLPVTFTDQSTSASGPVNSWLWDFGDGFTSPVQNPSHNYATAGIFNVTEIITNSNGCTNNVSKTGYITVYSNPVVNFDNSAPATCTAPATINFTNQSTGVGTLTYLWNFGDGNTSTATNPSNTYTSNGNFTVKLFAVSSQGCTDSAVKGGVLSIGTLQASFTSADSICVNDTLSFSNTSSPGGTSAVWDFGDGDTSHASNPVHAYSTAGTYTVSLTVTLNGCSNTTTKNVVIVANPVPAFTSTTVASCQAPLTVTFTDQSSGGVASYLWNFGDSTTSTLQNPSHTYLTLGNFNVTLTVTNAFGCSKTITKNNLITIKPPVISIPGLPDSSCSPFTKLFNATITSADPVTSYKWDFGDGTTANTLSASHTYNIPGSYDITFTITTASGCSDTVFFKGGIIASTKPVAAFVGNPTFTCAQTPVAFTDQTTGGATRWLWSFGEGGRSSLQNPVHVYVDTGYFTVQLIVWNYGCPDTLTQKKYIYIKAPVAVFSDSSNCGAPATVFFEDRSIGADTWSWDFGDGTFSNIPSPTHTYPDTGQFIATLTVTNISTGCNFSSSQIIKVISIIPQFYASDTIICKNNPLTFTRVVNDTTEINSYNWNFGDGDTASGTSVVHKYAQSGNYSVRLITTDIHGCKDTLIKPAYIRVNGPTAKFAPPAGGCLNLTTTFTDSSTTDGINPIKQWIWNFGDSSAIDTLSSPPFQHLYAATGNYTVSLTVIDSLGCSSTYDTSIIVAHPSAAFTSPNIPTCSNTPVNFTSQSSGTNLTYVWYLGDGDTSVAKNPAHSYAIDSLYTIKLVVTDQYGCMDSLTKPNYIEIATPLANFSASDTFSTCPPLKVLFTDSSIKTFSRVWNFGDGSSSSITNPLHFYTYPGIYTATLTATGPSGCTSVKTQKIVINGPTGLLMYNGISACIPVTVKFSSAAKNVVSYTWDYSDGSTLTTIADSSQHTYTYPGIYIPKMILTDTAGCNVAIVGVDTIKANGVVAAFNFLNHVLCDSGFVSFKDSSVSNESVSYLWNFGDGTTSPLSDPTHHYTTNGIYYPLLTATSASGCIDSLRATIPIKVVASPKISISNSPDSCPPLHELFTGNILVADTSAFAWHWDFDNENNSNSQNPPPQTYPYSGTYNVLLTATNSSGCADTVHKSIQAYPVPVITTNPNGVVCFGSSVTLNAAGANTYTWSPAAGLSCNNPPNCSSVTGSPITKTTYEVKGVSTLGCTDSASTTMSIQYPFTMNSSQGHDTICLGEKVDLFASGADQYIWSPSTGLNNPVSPTPIATPITTTNYTVIGSDIYGCFHDTGSVTINVYPVPTVNAGPDKTINVGDSVVLNAIVSPDAKVITWAPNADIANNFYFPGIEVKPNQTTSYKITVTNDGGCQASDDVTVYVVCNGANLFIPNTFSPNGDGTNEIFYPRGHGLFSVKSFLIFNRWGQVVFEKSNFLPNDPTAGWDGTFNGKKLDPDVYVYTIEIICDNNFILTYKGNVALMR